MYWVLNKKGNLILRGLVAADMPTVVTLTRQAFESDTVANDVEAMLTIYCKSSALENTLENQLDTLLPVSYYVLCRREQSSERILGITGLYRPVWAGKNVLWLGWFATDASTRGYGIILLRASLWLARRMGANLLCIETSNELAPAIALYSRMGFQTGGQIPGYWSNSTDLVFMYKHLDDIIVPANFA